MRSVAWSNTAGLYGRSNIKQWLAPTRFSPTPPALQCNMEIQQTLSARAFLFLCR